MHTTARVPGMFRLLACCYAALVSLGTLLLRLPPAAAGASSSADSRTALMLDEGLGSSSYQKLSDAPPELELAAVAAAAAAAAGKGHSSNSSSSAGSCGKRQFATWELPREQAFWHLSACFIMTGVCVHTVDMAATVLLHVL
jgi:hypothetical protein